MLHKLNYTPMFSLMYITLSRQLRISMRFSCMHFGAGIGPVKPECLRQKCLHIQLLLWILLVVCAAV